MNNKYDMFININNFFHQSYNLNYTRKYLIINVIRKEKSHYDIRGQKQMTSKKHIIFLLNIYEINIHVVTCIIPM